MRATDVRPTRFEAAKAAARNALAAVPERAQVALVAYSQTAYILVPPTHDHGAAAVGIAQARTAEGAAPGDAIAVALAAIPQQEQPGQDDTAAAPPAPGGSGNQVPKVPATIVWVGSGDITAGRPLPDAIAAARDAGVPVDTVGVGPKPGADQKAPYDEATLRQAAQLGGGRFFSNPSSRDWAQTFRNLGSAVTVRRKPQEIGHFVGAGSLAVSALAMVVSLLATRRLV
jgi:Ca-activated chloride channel family protein